MNLKIVSIFFVCTSLLFGQNTKSSTIVLQNGLNNYKGCKETFVVNNYALANYGTYSYFSVIDRVTKAATNGCCTKPTDTVVTGHGLITFDLSEVLNGITAKEAILSLYAACGKCSNSTNGCTDTMDCCNKTTMNTFKNGYKKLYLVTKEWDQTTASWKMPWTISGGDYYPVAVAESKDTIRNGWEHITVTSAIQNMSGDFKNYGLLIKFVDKGHYCSYVSSEAGDQQYRPKLTLVLNEKESNTGILSNARQKLASSVRYFSKGHIQISFEEKLTLSLTNMQGKIVYQTQTKPGSTHYTIPSRIPHGIYCLSINSTALRVDRMITLLR